MKDGDGGRSLASLSAWVEGEDADKALWVHPSSCRTHRLSSLTARCQLLALCPF